MNSQERDEYVEKMEETKQKFYEDHTKNQIFKQICKNRQDVRVQYFAKTAKQEDRSSERTDVWQNHGE